MRSLPILALALLVTFTLAPPAVVPVDQPVSRPVARSDAGEAPGPARLPHRPAPVPALASASGAVIAPGSATDTALGSNDGAPAAGAQGGAGIGIGPVFPAAETCADGTLVHDEVGGAAGVALGNLQVQLWDTGSGALRAAGLTAASGAFLLCASAISSLHVRVVTENGFWRIQDPESGEPHRFDLSTFSNVPPGTTVHYGLVKPSSSGALQIHNAVDRLWSWVASHHVNDCWDALDFVFPTADYSRCRQVVISWRADSAAATFYDSALNRVHLNAVDFKWRDTVVRETAKSIMDDLFEDDFPDTQACGTRISLGTPTTIGCAWVEGWADFVAVRVFNDTFLDWQVGAQVFHVDLESPGWDTPGWGTGETVEGRVAGALLDLADTTNEPPWDRLAEGATAPWLALLQHSWDPRKRYRALSEYWENRNGVFCGVVPQAVASDSALATVYQNTIDCGLRDPLTNGTAIVRRTPAPPQNFRYTTTTSYWSVVAIRPPADYDLRIFGTVQMTGTPLAISAAASNLADFIVVNSNAGRQPLGTFYPQVNQYSGTGNYDLKFLQASSSIGIGASVPAVMAAGNPVAIWEIVVAANAAVKVELAQPAGADGELFLFCSTTAPATWIRARSSATVVAPNLPSGLETLTWTAPATAPGYCAVVLIHRSGSGTYTVTRRG